MRHHAFVIEAGREDGVALAHAWARENLGGDVESVSLHYGLLSVEDARYIAGIASQTSANSKYRAIIITSDRAYHEAQNALLKLFEEPPEGTYIFLCMPSLGGLLPTLRSRVQTLSPRRDVVRPDVGAEEFLKANKEKRSAIIAKLASGKDDEEKREYREEAIALVNGIEALAYKNCEGQIFPKEVRELLSDISILREHLYDRSAPVKMILEHLSIVIPKDLV